MNIKHQTMKKSRIKILLSAIFLIVIASACSKKEDEEKIVKPEEVVLLKPGSYTDTILDNKVKRPFFYHIPQNLPDSCAIVFVFHGSIKHHNDANPSQIIDPLSYAKSDVFYYDADILQKYVYVFPKGEEQPDVNWINWANDVNLPYFVKLRDYFLKRYPKISHRKIYCCGHSSGAIFSLRIAHQLPELISAAVSVSGQYVVSRVSPLPGGPVPIMQINGKTDQSVNFGSALSNGRKAATLINGGTEEVLESGIPLGGYIYPAKSYVGDKYTWKNVKADYVFYGLNNVDHNISWNLVKNDMWKFMEDHPRK